MNIADVSSLPTTLTDDQAADLLGVSRWQLGELARTGRAPIEPLSLGRRRVWPTARLLAVVDLPDANEPEKPMDAPTRGRLEMIDRAAEVLCAEHRRRDRWHANGSSEDAKYLTRACVDCI